MNINQPAVPTQLSHLRNLTFAALLVLACFVNASAQWTNGTDITNTNSGNVGIGKSSPAHKLDVLSSSGTIARFDSTASANTQVMINAASGFNAMLVLQRAGVAQWTIGNIAFNDRFIFANAGSNEVFTIQQNGNVGIGTASPSEKLVTVGNMLAGNITSQSLLYSGYDTQSNVSFELGYGTATSAITPLANLVLSKNLTSANNGIGTIVFVNRSIANGNEKRVASIAGWTDGATNSGALVFGTTSTGTLYERMRIASNGKVGVGTASPSEILEVSGNLKVSGTGNITAAGTIEGNNIKAKYQDVAEWVNSSQELAGGTVVVLDSNVSNQVIASTQAYDSRVAGVISVQPGIALGEHGEGRVLVATTGRVKVKVDASRGPIRIGDLLVTSDKEGVAMKSVPVKFGGVRMHRPGTLIGKALEPLANGSGEILVLLSLQ